jgi:PAS domain S-box-containing protein
VEPLRKFRAILRLRAAAAQTDGKPSTALAFPRAGAPVTGGAAEASTAGLPPPRSFVRRATDGQSIHKDQMSSQAPTGAATPPGVYEVFPGESEMAARCRALDWVATPLGPVEGWPAALRWVVRTALEAPFPINLWCGPERVLIYNDGYRHVLGSKHPDSLGRPGTEVWREIWGEIAPMFTQILSGGPALYADDAPFVIERAGSPFEGEEGPNAWFTFSLSPVRDEEGEVVAFLNIVSETTARILAERATEAARREAEAAEARLRDVFAQAPAFMAVLRGTDFVFEFANDAYYQLVGHRELLGRPVFEALPEVRGQGFEDLLNGVLSTGEPFIGREVPVTVIRAPGAEPEERYVDLVYYPLTEADGSRTGVVAHGSDVTGQVRARRDVERKAEELARLAAALEASNRELDQFAYVASHDLKAPLRGISNLSQWIEDDLAERLTDESREHLSLLRGRVHRMEGLIDGILEYSRAGRVRGAAERVDTGALAREVVDLLAPPPQVRVEVAPEMPVIHTERLPLQQVFLNLIGNAVKHSGAAGGTVRVSARHDGGAWELAVSDEGPGIAPEFHERIWGMFQTLQPRDRVEGTGIGLSIVKKLVESRGGRAWVESSSGAGATFRVRWPATAADEG